MTGTRLAADPGLCNDAAPYDAALRVASLLRQYRYRWCDERNLQTQISTVLHEHFQVRAETALSVHDRPDFLVTVDSRLVAVEVKVKGAWTPVMRQLGRYAAHPCVDAVVLAAGRRALLPGLPERIHSKPVIGVYLNGPLQ